MWLYESNSGSWVQLILSQKKRKAQSARKASMIETNLVKYLQILDQLPGEGTALSVFSLRENLNAILNAEYPLNPEWLTAQYRIDFQLPSA